MADIVSRLCSFKFMWCLTRLRAKSNIRHTLTYIYAPDRDFPFVWQFTANYITRLADIVW